MLQGCDKVATANKQKAKKECDQKNKKVKIVLFIKSKRRVSVIRYT